jgi:hypothetical protein
MIRTHSQLRWSILECQQSYHTMRCRLSCRILRWQSSCHTIRFRPNWLIIQYGQNVMIERIQTIMIGSSNYYDAAGNSMPALIWLSVNVYSYVAESPA